MWTISVTVLFSVITNVNSTVLLGVGGSVLASYLIGLLPKAQFYCPTTLTNGTILLVGGIDTNKLLPTWGVTFVLMCVCFGISLPIFHKKLL